MGAAAFRRMREQNAKKGNVSVAEAIANLPDSAKKKDGQPTAKTIRKLAKELGVEPEHVKNAIAAAQ